MLKRSAYEAGAAWLGVGALTLTLLIAIAPRTAQRCLPSLLTTQESEEATSEPWPMNARGQTYGVQIDYQEPDLVRVVATNDRTGYALARDLREPTPRSPEEALRRQAEQEGKVHLIPVYESDGITRIGVFSLRGDAPAP